MATTALIQQPSNIFKVLLLGAESTGKTTLCQDLAQHFHTEWVAEYMRTYLQKKWDEHHQSCEWDDLLPIAIGQVQAENQATLQAKQFLFCDTGLFELMVYSYLYYERCLPEIEQFALQHHYDLIFLTDIDVPWQADDLRDKPHERPQIFALFQAFLQKHQLPFYVLSGSRECRLQQASEMIEREFVKNNI